LEIKDKIETQNLAKRISFIRPTIFGGFWDFQPNLAHADTGFLSFLNFKVFYIEFLIFC